MVEIENLSRNFGDVEAVKDLSLHLVEGDVFGFIGPNGAGKTTTISMLATLLLPTEGTATIGGYDIIDEPSEVRRLIGYMPDLFGIYDGIKVWEYLDFFAGAFRIERQNRKKVIDSVLELTDLGGKRDSFVEALSRGMKQRLCLAKTLINDPQVLLLDEPASGLDPRARIEIKELLKELRKMGKTIFISSHILTELSDLCNKIGIIEKGKLLVWGEVEKIMRQVRPMRRVKIKLLGETQEAESVVRQISHVHEAKLEGKSLSFEFSAGDEELSKVTEALFKANLKVVGVEEESINLEEIFMKITKGIVT